MTLLAITGGTGFVGGALIDAALADGRAVRALTRRPQAARDGVEWIEGSLEDPGALDRLVAGADAAIHVAGVVNAADRAGFVAGNVEGTRAMLAAADRAGCARFVHVSSLAAREPGLSDYGWSKAEAERLVESAALDWTIVRPPAIYGPGDHEQLELFRAARLRIVPLPPGGRLSVIHVADLARLLLAIATGGGPRTIWEADDGGAGFSYPEWARAVGGAVGRRVLPLPLPRAALALGARADRLLRGSRAKLTPDRVAYFVHPDWTVDPVKRPPPALWRPEIATRAGLAETARWYRAHGLL